MSKVLMTILFAAGFVATGLGQPAETPPSSCEPIEWCDIWISHANETNLPRVLLIGDSITRDYYPGVEKRLEGKAYVARLATSRFVSDPVLLEEVALVLDNASFDVIQFNNGMHGWQHSELEYKNAFPKLLETIRAHAPRAKLIWATTTTLRQSNPDKASDPSDQRIAERNAIGLSCIKGQNIIVDDLNALVCGHPEYHSDNVHFNANGIRVEASQVASRIESLLVH